MSLPVTPEDWLKLREETADTMPEVVGKVGLPAALLPYQQRAVGLLDTPGTGVLAIEKSRRIGLTWGLAAYAVLRAGRGRAARGMDVMYISYSQEMTREFVDACAMWARAFAIAAGEVAEILFDDGEEGGETRSIKAFRIGFASGFEIVGLSSAPRSLRGKQGVVIVDEAAFVDSLPELMKAALAFLMWGGQVVVCSTHNGAGNPFNTLVQDIVAGRLRYAHLRIDFDDALREGLYRRICLVKGEAWSASAETAWRDEIVAAYGEGADEELFCVPSQGSGAWLTGALVESRMTAEAALVRIDYPAGFMAEPETAQRAITAEWESLIAAEVARLDPGRLHALGFDFGRHIDLSVAKLLRVEADMKRSEAITIEMRRVPYAEQLRFVGLLMGAPRLMGAAFDATGAGEYIAEALGRRYGLADKDGQGGMVAAIKLSAEWYRVNMPPLKSAFEDGSIALRRDAETLADLRLVRMVRGVAQVPALRTGEKGEKRHGDAAVALALAWFASRMAYVEYDYRGAGGTQTAQDFDRPRHDDDRRDEWRRPLGSDMRGHL